MIFLFLFLSISLQQGEILFYLKLDTQPIIYERLHILPLFSYLKY